MDQVPRTYEINGKPCTAEEFYQWATKPTVAEGKPSEDSKNNFFYKENKMKFTNKKVEALDVKHKTWAVVCVDYAGEIFFDYTRLLDIHIPDYIRAIPAFSTLKEAKAYMDTLDKDIGSCSYKIVKLGVVV